MQMSYKNICLLIGRYEEIRCLFFLSTPCVHRYLAVVMVQQFNMR